MSEEDLQSAEDEFMNGPAGKAAEPEQDETESMRMIRKNRNR